MSVVSTDDGSLQLDSQPSQFNQLADA